MQEADVVWLTLLSGKLMLMEEDRSKLTLGAVCSSGKTLTAWTR